MAKYHLDTESESYRYDDSNNSSDESVTDLDIPDFNDKNAIQIAEYLDSKLHNVNKRSSGVSTSTDSGTKHCQSPPPERLWTPLSQSTPADIPPNKFQPKDILKAKSKLSKLSANANETIQETDDEHEDNDYTNQSTRGPSFQDETPSKAQKKSPAPVNLVEKQNKADETELQELRELKKYLQNLQNGSVILESFKQSNKNIKILTKEQFEKGEQDLKSLEADITMVKKQNSELKEEISILKDSNLSLKEVISLKSTTIEELNTLSEESKSKFKEVQKIKEEKEEIIQTLEKKLSDLIGDTSEEITPERFPSLSFKGSNGKSVYDTLELGLVDSLNLSKSHNIIKNILINLLVPFSETKETIPKIAKLLESEDVLCEFSNKLHKLIYEQDINISKFQNEQNGNDHLRQCTSQMYKNVETLFKELKPNV